MNKNSILISNTEKRCFRKDMNESFTLYSIASVQLNAAISDPLSHRKHNTSFVRSLFIPSFAFKLDNNKLVSRNATTAFL